MKGWMLESWFPSSCSCYGSRWAASTVSRWRVLSQSPLSTFPSHPSPQVICFQSCKTVSILLPAAPVRKPPWQGKRRAKTQNSFRKTSTRYCYLSVQHSQADSRECVCWRLPFAAGLQGPGKDPLTNVVPPFNSLAVSLFCLSGVPIFAGCDPPLLSSGLKHMPWRLLAILARKGTDLLPPLTALAQYSGTRQSLALN